MASVTLPPGPVSVLQRPGDLVTIWLIARRGAIESLRDRMTVGVSSASSLAIPLIVVLLAVRPEASQIGGHPGAALGRLIASYLLVVGLMPSTGSIGIAAGLFAGEKEQGSLLPLLASPASNRAIFAGKVLGAVLPALLYSAIAEISYLVDTWRVLGVSALTSLPLALAGAIIALIPVNAVLGATVASLVSSRVRTYQSAQMLTSLALFPLMGGIFALTARLQLLGAPYLLIEVVVLIALEAALVAVSAATWRREEVMARR